jgi:hypothetical protein
MSGCDFEEERGGRLSLGSSRKQASDDRRHIDGWLRRSPP